MTRRDLGLLIAPDPPPGVATLARLLDRWCVPRAADPRHDLPAAWLASSSRAPGLDDALESGVPVAVWVATAGDIAALGHRARGPLLVTDAANAVDGHDVMVVGGAIDVQRFPYVSPFVRARWRAARGLPATMVAVIDLDGSDVDEDVGPTMFALASAVAVTGPRLLEALAWGAPCATDAESAAMAGAVDGRDVVVAAPDRLRDAASDLASNPVLAATLSRAGRRLVERRHDRGRTPLALARRLGLVGSTAAGRIDEALDELWTPTRARIRDRVDEALAPLVGA
jgi:hypothetical protein